MDKPERTPEQEQETPKPDPGNSPPEEWTEAMDPAEVQDLAERLQRESGGDA